MKMKIKNKLIFSVILVISIFGIIAVGFVFFQVESKLITESKKGLESISKVQSHGAAVIFERGSDLAKSIVNDPAVIEYMRAKKSNSIIEKPYMFGYVGSQVEISDRATYYRLTHYNIGGNYLAIYLIGLDGTTFVSTDETFVGKNYAFRDYFRRAVVGEPWVDISIGVTSKQLGYYFSYPVRSDVGDIVGVAVVKMSPDILFKYINSNNVASNEITMLVDQYGVIISTNDQSKLYKSLGQISQENLTEINDKKRYNEMKIEPLDYDEVQSELGSVTNNKNYEIDDKIDNRREILSVVKIGDFPFFLVIDRSLTEFSGSSMFVALFLALFVLFGATFAMMFIIFFINKLLNPLSVLKVGAEEISKENFDYKINIKTNDEFEELGNSFNYMSDKLRKFYSDSNKQIEKLKKINKLMVGREKKMIELKKEIKINKQKSELS